MKSILLFFVGVICSAISFGQGVEGFIVNEHSPLEPKSIENAQTASNDSELAVRMLQTAYRNLLGKMLVWSNESDIAFSTTDLHRIHKSRNQTALWQSVDAYGVSHLPELLGPSSRPLEIAVKELIKDLQGSGHQLQFDTSEGHLIYPIDVNAALEKYGVQGKSLPESFERSAILLHQELQRIQLCILTEGALWVLFPDHKQKSGLFDRLDQEVARSLKKVVAQLRKLDLWDISDENHFTRELIGSLEVFEDRVLRAATPVNSLVQPGSILELAYLQLDRNNQNTLRLFRKKDFTEKRLQRIVLSGNSSEAALETLAIAILAIPFTYIMLGVNHQLVSAEVIGLFVWGLTEMIIGRIANVSPTLHLLVGGILVARNQLQRPKKAAKGFVEQIRSDQNSQFLATPKIRPVVKACFAL